MIGKLRGLLVLGLLAGGLLRGGVAAALPFEVSYGGRLTSVDGTPVQGPVTLRVKLYVGADGAQDSGIALPDAEGVALTQGTFQVPLKLTPAEAQTLFGSGAAVWIEITDATHGRTYPKQTFSAVPYALQVPVDGTSITFNPDGKLTVATVDSAKVAGLDASLAGKAATTHAHTLAGDVSGSLTGTTVTKIQGQPVTTAAPGPSQVLQWNGTAWAPATVGGVGTPESTTVTNLGTGQGVYAGMGGAGNFQVQLKSLAAGTGISLGATATDVTISSTITQYADANARGAVSASAPLNYVSGTGVFSMPAATSVGDGYLALGDYVAFNAKQAAITASSTVNAGTLTTAQQNGVELKVYGAGAGNTGELRFDDLAAGGTNYVALKAPDTVAANVTFTLPGADGSTGEVLKTDGSGHLAWVAIPSAPVTTVAGRTGAITLSTTDVAEGTNQYYTDARARAAITGTAPIAVSGTGAVSLTNTAVSAGSYSRANVTVDAQGRLTAASNGASVNLTSEVTGTLPVANGGTGATSAATNLVFASPNGSTGAPSFRALAAADVPSLTAAKISDFTAATNAAETDPKVGTNTTNYLSKWNGSALVAGAVYDNGSIGINTTSPGAQLQVNTPSAATTGIVVKGSASQTNNLQEWVRSDGAVLASVTSTGGFGGFAEGRKGTDLPSAATLTLGADGDFFNVTGTTNISAISAKNAGARVTLYFNGVLTLVHSAVAPKLILAGGGNYKTAAGAIFEFISLGGGDWQELTRYVKNDSHVFAVATGTAQSMPNNTHTAVILNTVTEDHQSEYNNATGLFTAKQNGTYSVQGQVLLSGAFTTGAYCHSMIYKNGVNIVLGTLFDVFSAASSFCSTQTNITLDLNAGDTLYLDIFQNSGSSLSTTVGPGYNYLSVTRLR